MDSSLLQGWAEATALSLQAVWGQVLGFVPKALGVGVVFIIGLAVASALGHFVESILGKIKIDSVVSSTGIDKEFERAGLKFNLARFFGRLTYWLGLIVTVVLVTNSLFGQDTVTNLLKPIFDFIPQVAAAVIILLGSVVLANFLKSVVQAAIVGARLHAPAFVATVAWWAVVVFGFIAALKQLGVGDFIVSIASTVITAAVFGTALAMAIAFGLGGKDAAARCIDKCKDMFGK